MLVCTTFMQHARGAVCRYVPTVYMDVVEQGWACNATNQDSLQAECEAEGGRFRSGIGACMMLILSGHDTSS